MVSTMFDHSSMVLEAALALLVASFTASWLDCRFCCCQYVTPLCVEMPATAMSSKQKEFEAQGMPPVHPCTEFFLDA
jgi:hypothetical protein